MALSHPSLSSGGRFDRFADGLSYAIGQPPAFVIALFVVVAWAATGPLAGFSDTWQLIINTGTTVITFLMVFLLGNASNRITERQDAFMERILEEEHSLDSEERLIRKLLDRIDVDHIKPILNHLDEQDHELRAVAERMLQALQKTAD
jgi:low affinity Fe/Cu permease